MPPSEGVGAGQKAQSDGMRVTKDHLRGRSLKGGKGHGIRLSERDEIVREYAK